MQVHNLALQGRRVPIIIHVERVQVELPDGPRESGQAALEHKDYIAHDSDKYARRASDQPKA